ncbi:hypothetical protein [Pseudomonas viridiflava]|uniref:hypothetical protein n=1 Tax=Pseudomonas viridiflava TaxID=33069 RepID=UPI0013DC703C|nr:hypothetical protein [Pseudomonas viridiflava]
MVTHLRHIQERTRSVLGGIPTRSVGTISVISSAGDAGDPVFQENRVIVIAGKPPLIKQPVTH